MQKDAYNRALMGVDTTAVVQDSNELKPGSMIGRPLFQPKEDEPIYVGDERKPEDGNPFGESYYFDENGERVLGEKPESISADAIPNDELLEDYEIQLAGLKEEAVDANHIIDNWLSQFSGMTESDYTREQYEEAKKDIVEINEELTELEAEMYTLEVHIRIDDELEDSSQISLVDWTNIYDPELADEDKEAIMDADLKDLDLSNLVSRVEYDFETLLKTLEQEVINEGLEHFEAALEEWKDGEDFFIKDLIFNTYGEHIELEDINLNDLRNDYAEQIWTSNQIDERFTNRVNELITGRIEPYLLEKTNYVETDEGYSFEIPPNFAEYMVAYSEANEVMLEQQGQDISAGAVVAGGVATAVTATALTAVTAGAALVIALIVGAAIGVVGAVWGNHVASDKQEWDAIADHIKDHEITDSNLVISVTYEENGDTGILINDREE